MRRLRPGFANPGSGGWANAVRPTLRSGCMCNDVISGGAAAGLDRGYPLAFSSGSSPTCQAVPGHDRICRQGELRINATVSGERQVRTEIAARGTRKAPTKN